METMKEMQENATPDMSRNDLEDVLTEVEIAADKARAVLRSTIDTFKLNNPNLSEFEKRSLGEQVPQIYSLLEVVDDYLCRIEASIEGGAAE